MKLALTKAPVDKSDAQTIAKSTTQSSSSTCNSARNSIDINNNQTQTQSREFSRSFSSVLNPIHESSLSESQEFLVKQKKNHASAALLPVLKQISKAPSKIELLNRRKHWGFVRTNTDLLAAKPYLERINEPTYDSYLQIPNCLEIMKNMQKERNHKKKLLKKRRQQHYMTSFERVATDNQILHTKLKFQMMLDAAAQQQSPQLQSQSGETYESKQIAVGDTTTNTKKESRVYAKLQKIVDIVSSEPSKRNFQDLLFLYQWLTQHCSKNSVIYKFLKAVNYLDGIHFVQGLRYNIYDNNSCVIKQNEIGNDFFILLSGQVSVHINDLLINTNDLPNIKTNEKMYGKLGIGKLIDTMNKMGDNFGEYSLLSGKPRNATVICNRISQFLICTREHFQQCLEKYTYQITDAKIKELKQFFIFNQSSKIWLQSILKRFTKCVLNAGSVILQQNTIPDKVYFMLDAKCQQTYHNNCNNNSNNNSSVKTRSNTGIIKILNGKQMIGAYYAINDIKSPSNVIVTNDCEAIVIDKTKFVRSMIKIVNEKINQVGLGQHQHTVNQINQMFRRHNKHKKNKNIQQTIYNLSKLDTEINSLDRKNNFDSTAITMNNNNKNKQMKRFRSASALLPQTQQQRQRRQEPPHVHVEPQDYKHGHIKKIVVSASESTDSNHISEKNNDNTYNSEEYVNNTQRRLRSRSLINVKTVDIQNRGFEHVETKLSQQTSQQQVKQQLKLLSCKLNQSQQMHDQLFQKKSIANNHRIAIKNKKRIKRDKRAFNRLKLHHTTYNNMPLMAVKSIDTAHAKMRVTKQPKSSNGVRLPRLVFPSRMRNVSHF